MLEASTSLAGVGNDEYSVGYALMLEQIQANMDTRGRRKGRSACPAAPQSYKDRLIHCPTNSGPNSPSFDFKDTGNLLVSGVQLGNVWIGVQPALGVEGDPMRLLFERDLTPHPQYAAFYQWLQHGFQANAVLHFGMHGTVEWLPGAPLGIFTLLFGVKRHSSSRWERIGGGQR